MKVAMKMGEPMGAKKCPTPQVNPLMRVKWLRLYVIEPQENKEPCQVKLLNKNQVTKMMRMMKNLLCH
jgi:hypothetical protein